MHVEEGGERRQLWQAISVGESVPKSRAQKSHVTSKPSSDYKVDLDDVLLYYMVKTAQRQGDDLKVQIPSIHRAMSQIQDILKQLKIRVRFHTNPVETYSLQVDEALKLLAPYEIEIRNPRFVVLLRRDAASAQIQRIERAIPQQVRTILDSGLQTFEDEIEA